MTCQALGCERTKILARGLCGKHYQRFQKHGDLNRNDREGPKMPLADRFWSKVATGSDEECWEWTGAVNDKLGYGSFGAGAGRRGRTVLAHRKAWELTFGEIRPGLCVLHSCDNPPCCNPAHLWLGTYADNAADRVAKRGR